MKKIILANIVLFFTITSFAQVQIDSKYKNPGKVEKNKIDINSIVVSPQLMDSIKNNTKKYISQINSSNYQKIQAVHDKEYNAFNIYGDEVWIYEDEFYNGRKKILKLGKYTLNDLGIYWNDKISSMLIPLKYDVEIYVDDNFKNEHVTLSGYGVRSCMQCYSTDRTTLCFDYVRLADKIFKQNNTSFNYNDQVSSIEIKPIQLK